MLDTGPVVAAIDRSDNHHARYAALLESAEGPLLIPTTVIVEVCWLVEERPDIEAAFLEAIAAGEFGHRQASGSVQCTHPGRRRVLPRASASGTHGRRGTARHAPTASQVRSSVPKLAPCSGHNGAAMM